MKRGAIFDMDGLMFDTEKVYQKTWLELAEERGVNLSPAFAGEICGTAGDVMVGVLQKHFHTDSGDARAVMDSCMDRVRHKLSAAVPEKPGVRDIIGFFRLAGVKIAVASSSREEQIRSNLRTTGLAEEIDVIVSGFSVQNSKPAPDIFLKAAAKLGLPAEDCYVFEDGFNGVRAGHAAGSFTVMIPDLLVPDDEMRMKADAICGSLSDALDSIRDGLW